MHDKREAVKGKIEMLNCHCAFGKASLHDLRNGTILRDNCSTDSVQQTTLKLRNNQIIILSKFTKLKDSFRHNEASNYNLGFENKQGKWAKQTQIL